MVSSGLSLYWDMFYYLYSHLSNKRSLVGLNEGHYQSSGHQIANMDSNQHYCKEQSDELWWCSNVYLNRQSGNYNWQVMTEQQGQRKVYTIKGNPEERALWEKESAERAAANRKARGLDGGQPKEQERTETHSRPNQGMFPPSSTVASSGGEDRKPSNMAKKTGKSPDEEAASPARSQNMFGGNQGGQGIFKPSPAGSNSLISQVGQAPKPQPQSSSGGIFPLPSSSPAPLPVQTQQAMTTPQTTAIQPGQSAPIQAVVGQSQQISMFTGNNQPPASNIFNNNPVDSANMGMQGGGMIGEVAKAEAQELDEAQDSDTSHLLRMTTSEFIKQLNSRYQTLLTAFPKIAQQLLQLVKDEKEGIKVQENLQCLKEHCSPHGLLGEALELEKSQNELMDELVKIEAKMDQELGQHELVRLEEEAELLFAEAQELSVGYQRRPEEEQLWVLCDLLQQIEKEAGEMDQRISALAHKTNM